MTLFKSLANTQIGEPGSSSSSSSSSNKHPAFPPTAIQLYSSKYIHFISGTIQKFHDNDNNNSHDGDGTNGDNDDNDNNGDINNNDNNHNDENENDARNRISKKDLKTIPRRYEIVSYQPVHVNVNASTAADTVNNTANTANTAPNLGIWDCRLTSLCNSKSTSYLLKSALHHNHSNNNNNSHSSSNGNTKSKNNINHQSSPKPTFVLTIDLENMEDVHTTVSTMMESVYQSLNNSSSSSSSNNSGSVSGSKEEEKKQQEQQHQTTSNDSKQDTASSSSSSSSSLPPSSSSSSSAAVPSPLPKFGIAPSSKENETQKIKEDLFHNANIILSVILPYSLTQQQQQQQQRATSTKSTMMMTYKEKQGLNLILYHLMKYATMLNCTLCFLNQNDTYEDENEDTDVNDSTNANANANTNTTKDENDADGMNRNRNMTPNSNEYGLIPHGMSVKEFKHVLRLICFRGMDIGSMTSTMTTISGDDDGNHGGEMDQIVMSMLKKNNVVQLTLDGRRKDRNGSLLLGAIDEEQKDDTTEEGKDDKASSNDDDDDDKNLAQVQTSIYFPSSYNVDLIDSVYLRSASCAGVWDATTDNLWVALPPSSSSLENAGTSSSSSSSNKNTNHATGTGGGGGGDDEWLSKLADSVSAYTNSAFGMGQSVGSKSVMMEEGSMKSGRTKIKDGSSVVTTSTKNKSRVGRKKPSGVSSKKTGDKVDVSDFFTDLLKN